MNLALEVRLHEWARATGAGQGVGLGYGRNPIATAMAGGVRSTAPAHMQEWGEAVAQMNRHVTALRAESGEVLRVVLAEAGIEGGFKAQRENARHMGISHSHYRHQLKFGEGFLLGCMACEGISDEV